MKSIPKLVLMSGTAVLLYLTDIPHQPAKLPITVQLMPKAEAVWGNHRRTRRRSVAVGYAAGTSAASAQTSSEAVQSNSASTQTAAVPVGTTVSALPDGCTTTTQAGVQYHNCGGVYYRTAFEGNNLVYVVAQP